MLPVLGTAYPARPILPLGNTHRSGTRISCHRLRPLKYTIDLHIATFQNITSFHADMPLNNKTIHSFTYAHARACTCTRTHTHTHTHNGGRSRASGSGKWGISRLHVDLHFNTYAGKSYHSVQTSPRKAFACNYNL
jgi:hypothetical protein